MSPHTDAGALLKLAEDAFEFIRLKLVDDLDEPQRSAFWKAVEMREKLRQAASQGSAGGEAVASPQEVQEACAQVADHTALRCIREQIPGDATANFIAKAIRALIPPVKTGGDAETSLYKDAIDQALVVRRLGVAAGDPVKELDTILSWEVAVALDPRVSEAAQALIDQGRYPAQEAKHCGVWQPIETAPKNRMLLVGFFNSAGKWRSMHAQYRDDLPQHDDAADDDEPAESGWYEGSLEAEVLFPVRPTHWQPLPDAPSVPSASREGGQ